MLPLNWQDLAAILLVLAAAVYLWRRVRRRVTRIRRPCCPGCPNSRPGKLPHRRRTAEAPASSAQVDIK